MKVRYNCPSCGASFPVDTGRRLPLLELMCPRCGSWRAKLQPKGEEADER